MAYGTLNQSGSPYFDWCYHVYRTVRTVYLFVWQEGWFVVVDHIPLEKLRRSLGRVAQDVERGSSVVVERRGEEAFAMVPMRLYRLLEEERRSVVEATGRAREAFSDLSEEEIENLVSDELEAAREKRSSSEAGS